MGSSGRKVSVWCGVWLVCGVWWVACGMKKGTGRLGYEELGSRGAHEGSFVRDEVRLVN